MKGDYERYLSDANFIHGIYEFGGLKLVVVRNGCERKRHLSVRRFKNMI